MSRHLRIHFWLTSLVALILSCVGPGCRLEGEFDPDIGRRDDDTVYRTPARVPR